MDILLLTATVDPGQTPVVTLRDPEIRLIHYVAATMLWARQGPFGGIVLCENSGKGSVLAGLRSVVEAAGKSFEFLEFDGNRGAQTRGKGHGEGCILAHASLKSVLLQKENHFWKSTGRLFVENAAELVEQHAGDEVVMSPGDTRFFKVSARFFEDHMLGLYRSVDDNAGTSIEVAYERAFVPFRKSGRIIPFKSNRVYVGQEAGSGNWNARFPTELLSEATAWTMKAGV